MTHDTPSAPIDATTLAAAAYKSGRLKGTPKGDEYEAQAQHQVRVLASRLAAPAVSRKQVLRAVSFALDCWRDNPSIDEEAAITDAVWNLYNPALLDPTEREEGDAK